MLILTSELFQAEQLSEPPSPAQPESAASRRTPCAVCQRCSLSTRASSQAKYALCTNQVLGMLTSKQLQVASVHDESGQELLHIPAGQQHLVLHMDMVNLGSSLAHLLVSSMDIETSPPDSCTFALIAVTAEAACASGAGLEGAAVLGMSTPAVSAESLASPRP